MLDAHSRGELFRPPVGLGHTPRAVVVGRLALTAAVLRRRAAPLLAAARAEVVDCGGDVRLLGHYSAPQKPAPRPRDHAARLGGQRRGKLRPIVGGALYAAGFAVFRLNFRDHGATHELNKELFHSCRIDEVVDATERIIECTPAPRTFLIGHSLGGNFALRVAVRSEAASLSLARSSRSARCSGRIARCARWKRDSGSIGDIFYTAGGGRCSPNRRASRASMTSAILRRFTTLTATTDFFVRPTRTFRISTHTSMATTSPAPRWQASTVPTRLIAAVDDPVIPIGDLGDVAQTGRSRLASCRAAGTAGFLKVIACAAGWTGRSLRISTRRLDQAWRFSWNVTGASPLVTLISPSITAPSATAIELPDKLPLTLAVPAISTRCLAIDVAFDYPGHDDVRGLERAPPLTAVGKGHGTGDVAISFDDSAEYVRPLARDRADDLGRRRDVSCRPGRRVLYSSLEYHRMLPVRMAHGSRTASGAR